ncbi:21073_t:CDS:2, partial [Dentiscutata erythropus]
MVWLSQDAKLDEVRKELMKSERSDHQMGSNCRFLYYSRKKAEIEPDDESKYDLLEIVESADNEYTLYIIQDKNKWRKSLGDGATWKIIGYDEIYSLFELLSESLQRKVLGVLGHKILKAKIEEIEFNLEPKKAYIYQLSPHIKEIKNIGECNILASIASENGNVFSLYVDHMNNDQDRPVIVINHIQGNESKLAKAFSTLMLKKAVKIKLCWIIIGSLTSFNFNTQYPLTLKSGKYTATGHKTDKCGKFGTCVLEPTSNKKSDSINNTNTGKSTNPTHHNIYYNPKDSTYAIGNYFSSLQESAYLFIYDITNRKKVTDESVLQRLALYNWQ